MNENAKKWAKALRSGEFKQGQGALRPNENQHCCLGVACELYRREVGGSWTRYEHGSLSEWVFTAGPALEDQSSALLPPQVRRWLGLASADGVFNDGTLSGKNDINESFEYIANVIETASELYQ